MFETSEDLLSRLLGATVEELDITPRLHDAAERQYKGVGQFLADQSDLGVTEWDVYPQGSFRLGTVVRPLGADHYDLDMVCRLDIARTSITQARLKERVGGALAGYLEATAGQSGAPTGCHDARRVWTLEYAKAFHMDVLPAIPNDDDFPSGILLTDKQLREWQRSNPIAYADWFHARMAAERLRKLAELAKRKDIEPVPDWQIKTTLQRVVQVLKRHRDIHFAEDFDDRPPSILVTTLASHAYVGEQDLFTAVVEATERMPNYIEHSDGVWRVMSPVADENFADKWAEHPERAKKFDLWLQQLAADLEDARRAQGLDKVTARLAESFGAAPVTKAAARLADEYRTTREAGDLKAVSSGILSTAAGTAVRPHGFFGGSPE
jgi:hypothetical protein